MEEMMNKKSLAVAVMLGLSALPQAAAALILDLNCYNNDGACDVSTPTPFSWGSIAIADNADPFKVNITVDVVGGKFREAFLNFDFAAFSNPLTFAGLGIGGSVSEDGLTLPPWNGSFFDVRLKTTNGGTASPHTFTVSATDGSGAVDLDPEDFLQSSSGIPSLFAAVHIQDCDSGVLNCRAGDSIKVGATWRGVVVWFGFDWFHRQGWPPEGLTARLEFFAF
jgi:hypothetical protein